MTEEPVDDKPISEDDEEEEAQGRTRHLLLVDDDEHILRSLKLYLEMEGFRVTSASNGAEALQRVGEDAPELVILDVMMPGMDGFQVLEKLKGSGDTRAIPVIMLTAKGQDADVLRGYQQGAASYMTKPVNYDELVDNINLIFRNEENQEDSGKVYET